MIIECPSCHTRYQYDDARFGGQPSKKTRCARCRSVFEIHNPSASPPPPPAPVPVPEATIPRDTPAGEDTRQRRHARSSPPAEHETESKEAAVAVAESEESETASADPPLGLPKGKRLSLAIIDGPGSGKVYRVEKPRVVIGRSGADLVLDDTEASRLHAAIEVHDTAIYLEDLGSRNGTFCEQEQISGRVELPNHSEFTVGTTTLMLIITDEQ